MTSSVGRYQLLPLALVGVLVVGSTWWDGAFDLRYWGPLTVLALAVLIGVTLSGQLSGLGDRSRLVVVAAIWGLALWAILSAAWGESPGDAWEQGARDLAYAAILTLGLTLRLDPVQRRWVSGALCGGVVLVMVVTLIQLLVKQADAFTAGRIDDPAGYRNAAAALFAFTVWPLIGVAAVRNSNPASRAAAFSMAVMALSLAFLTQSRGIVVGLAAGAAVSLAIGPDRLRRAWLAIAAVIGVAAASGSLLAPYHAFDGGAGSVADSDATTALTALILLVVASFGVALLAFIYDGGIRHESTSAVRTRRVATIALVAFILVGAVAALIKVGSPTGYVSDKIDEFKSVQSEGSTTGTRLGSVGGQRYDLWRVALNEFGDHPIEGVGAGSYRFGYYEHRETDRNLSDPHSLIFQLLSETGIVGFGLFAAALIALGIVIRRRAREAERPERIWIAGIAAAGATVLVQTFVDWIWLFPAIIGMSLLALGIAGGPGAPDREDEGEPAPSRLWLNRAAAVGLALLLVGVGSLYLSDLYVRKARKEALSSPTQQLSAARTAGRLDPLSITPLYLQASAHETLGQRSEARADLQKALDREPRNFVTLSLLGDFEVRAGILPRAREYYRRALALDPRDSGLQKLSNYGATGQ